MNRAQRRYLERNAEKIQKQIIKEELKKLKANPEKYKEDAKVYFEQLKLDIENGKTD